MSSKPPDPSLIPEETGTYILVMEVTRSKQVEVGSLGLVTFKKGFYAYVGSALGGLRRRVIRYLHGTGKPHWHVDYLLAQAHLAELLLYPAPERLECTLSRALARYLEPRVPGFGASDCLCPTHLYYAPDRRALEEALAGAGGVANRPRVTAF